MRVLLMHPDRDWDQEPALTASFRTFRRPAAPAPPRHEQALMQDLALETLLGAMADGDEFLFEVGRRALLHGLSNDVETIVYRQEVAKDCLENEDTVRDLYRLVVEAVEGRRRHQIGDYVRHPSSILYSAVEALRMYVDLLRRLRVLAATHGRRFASRGWRTLFSMLLNEFSDEYVASIEGHLTDLEFRQGTLLSAALGRGNEGTGYVLRRPVHDPRHWWDRILGKGPPGYTFRIDGRDEAGARAVGELRDRGINLVANALAQSTDHIVSFFEAFRAELAFYVGALNLCGRLAPRGLPTCMPRPEPAGRRTYRCTGLYDVSLALRTDDRIVGNDVDAGGAGLVIVTGANQGGKSTFLRSVGLAQLMMQAGMFVGAASFSADLCSALFTHYKREEDATMTSGKLDEELGRMSQIVDDLGPNALLLFNESFAATNDREGSEIAGQIVKALRDAGVRIFFVTHLYEFAHRLHARRGHDAAFLRAERRPDGTRTFKVLPGEPLQTSFGADLYEELFSGTRPPSATRIGPRSDVG
jgi:hypothetical protein